MKIRRHRSVLVEKVLQYLITNPSGVYVDATVGDGGHCEAILKKYENARIIGIDIDQSAIDIASKTLLLFANKITLIHGNFADLESLVREEAEQDFVDGILFDLGLRWQMIDDANRGFSFKKDSPLDMRFDTRSQKTAYMVVNSYPERLLAKILKGYGDVPQARRIAGQIVNARTQSPIATTAQLAHIIESLFPTSAAKNILPKLFQAIRIEVNDELQNLKSALMQALEILKPKGRIAVITYHSGEDRIVKRFFATEARDCICPPGLPVCRCGHKKTIEILTQKPIRPDDDEIKQNPRSRAAKLRVVQKISCGKE